MNSHITPANLKIGIILTNVGAKFACPFQSHLDKSVVFHERTPPHTSQYNGIVERSLGLLRVQAIALLLGVTEGKTDRLLAGAMNHAPGISNRCVTTSEDKIGTPYEVQHGRATSFGCFLPLSQTVGCMKNPTHAHKVAPRGVQCILLGMSRNHLRNTFRVHDLTTGTVAIRRVVI